MFKGWSVVLNTRKTLWCIREAQQAGLLLAVPLHFLHDVSTPIAAVQCQANVVSTMPTRSVLICSGISSAASRGMCHTTHGEDWRKKSWAAAFDAHFDCLVRG